MSNIQQPDEGNNKTFSVKVPTWAWQLLNIIAESREHGTNGNDLLKKCMMFIIETAKIDGPVPVEFKTLLNMLKLDTSWHGAFNFADSDARLDIAQVVLILQQHDGKKPRKGFGLCMIDKPFMGEATANFCVDDILERVVEVSMAGLYNDLRDIGRELDSQSLRETLTIMCDAQKFANLEDSDRNELPGYGDRHDYGRAIAYGMTYKRKPRRTPDSLANAQQRIRFDDDDATTTDLPESYGEKADAYLAELEARAKAEENGSDDLPEGMVRPFDQEY